MRNHQCLRGSGHRVERGDSKMDLHQFPRVKSLSSLWSHQLQETQVSSITFCTSACICLGIDRSMWHAQIVYVYGDCKKRDYLQRYEENVGNCRIYCNTLGLVALDVFIIWSPQGDKKGCTSRNGEETLWGEGCLSGHGMQPALDKATERK